MKSAANNNDRSGKNSHRLPISTQAVGSDAGVKIDFGLLQDFLKEIPEVICCYCFGSARDGFVQAGSDLDLAIFMVASKADSTPKKALSHQFQREQEKMTLASVLVNNDLCDPLAFYQLYSEICDLYPDLECIDITNLGNADPILAIEALSGRMIVNNDRDKTAALASLASREYEDVMANLKYQYSLAVSGEGRKKSDVRR